MINSRIFKSFTAAAFAAWFLASGVVTFGADTPTPSTKEMREQMAQAHEKMATCLRSDRAISECRQEMTQMCRAHADYPGCGMMTSRDAMHGKGMQNAAPSSETTTPK